MSIRKYIARFTKIHDADYSIAYQAEVSAEADASGLDLVKNGT
ncbi:MAG: hypothetical protein AABY51_00225 [Deltaproteobacteria bacterium]